MFITHDFDEALKLADRIAIMKDGIIEQLDTPANIVLNPATEYVRKFTEEVPREKVLLIEDVMDTSKENLGELKVLKDEIIENVAEKILTQEKSVAVVDNDNNIIGSINPAKIIKEGFISSIIERELPSLNCCLLNIKQGTFNFLDFSKTPAFGLLVIITQ